MDDCVDIAAAEEVEN
uniref:Uncharacterized protein n=1 Tax=Rhizophora mucronata TaxID=61149 RepID=A0A2P2ND50_RHIMU